MSFQRINLTQTSSLAVLMMSASVTPVLAQNITPSTPAMINAEVLSNSALVAFSQVNDPSGDTVTFQVQAYKDGVLVGTIDQARVEEPRGSFSVEFDGAVFDRLIIADGEGDASGTISNVTFNAAYEITPSTSVTIEAETLSNSALIAFSEVNDPSGDTVSFKVQAYRNSTLVGAIDRKSVEEPRGSFSVEFGGAVFDRLVVADGEGDASGTISDVTFRAATQTDRTDIEFVDVATRTTTGSASDVAAYLTAQANAIIPATTSTDDQKLFASFDYENSTAEYSNSFFVRKLDLTGIAWNGNEYESKPGIYQRSVGTMITDRHIVSAAHAGLRTGETVVFFASDGTTVEREVLGTLKAARFVKQNGSEAYVDLQVGLLDVAVPPSIATYRVLDSDEQLLDLLGRAEFDVPVLSTSLTGAGGGDNRKAGYTRFEGLGEVTQRSDGSCCSSNMFAGDTSFAIGGGTLAPKSVPEDTRAEGGPSSYPSFMIVDGELVLATVNHVRRRFNSTAKQFKGPNLSHPYVKGELLRMVDELNATYSVVGY